MSVRCLSIYLLYTQPSARAVVRVEVEAAAHALPDDLGLVCEGAIQILEDISNYLI